MNGEIKRVFVEKGFGFIKGEDGADYFLHRSAFRGVQFESLEEGNASPSRWFPARKASAPNRCNWWSLERRRVNEGAFSRWVDREPDPVVGLRQSKGVSA
jgi:hypothetical protein